jgi:hypothetical protein
LTCKDLGIALQAVEIQELAVISAFPASIPKHSIPAGSATVFAPFFSAVF